MITRYMCQLMRRNERHLAGAGVIVVCIDSTRFTVLCRLWKFCRPRRFTTQLHHYCLLPNRVPQAVSTFPTYQADNSALLTEPGPLCRQLQLATFLCDSSKPPLLRATRQLASTPLTVRYELTLKAPPTTATL